MPKEEKFVCAHRQHENKLSQEESADPKERVDWKRTA
jgi:hypothetical protein